MSRTSKVKVPSDGRCFWHAILLHPKVNGSPVYDTIYAKYHAIDTSDNRNRFAIALRRGVMRNIITMVRRYVLSNGAWDTQRADVEIPEDLLVHFGGFAYGGNVLGILPSKATNAMLRKTRLAWLAEYAQKAERRDTCATGRYIDAPIEMWATEMEIKVTSVILHVAIVVVSSRDVIVYQDAKSKDVIVIKHINNNHFELHLTPQDMKRVRQALE